MSTTSPDLHRYFEAPDGHGEQCIWVSGVRPDFDAVIIRERSVTAGAWPDVVARMTGTTIANDDATVERLAMLLHDAGTEPTGIPWATMLAYESDAADEYRELARAILAALTGVPHD